MGRSEEETGSPSTRHHTGYYPQEINQQQDTSHDLCLPSRPKTPRSLHEKQKLVLLDSLRFHQIDARLQTIKNAHVKTCQWLLTTSEYLEWLDPTKLGQHHGCLWITGKPGAGKSTLMKFALDDARRKKDKITSSFFFNARGDDLEKSTIGMYRALSLQLLEQLPYLQGVIDYSPLRTPNGSPKQWTIESLKALFEQAVLGLGKSSLVCFIDALDECDELQIRDMISFFEDVGERTTSAGIAFRVCLSSRHYPHITASKGLHLVLENQEGHSQDILRYTSYELKIGHSDLAEQIRVDLEEKASGIFLWVILMVDILNKEHDDGRIQVLRRRLKETPRDIYGLFCEILRYGRDCRDELILCLQWVLFARHPLKPEQLFFAILSGAEPEALSMWNPGEATAPSINRYILDFSRGLAEVTRSKPPTVRFVHESVRDFLLCENGLKDIWPDLGTNFQGESHERLKRCCLDYIRIGIAGLKVSKSLPKASSQQAAEARQRANEAFPFLEYAVRNVLYHADAAEGGGVSQTIFFQSFPLADWIKLDNLLEKHDERRHTRKASLLYLLAERNMKNLISRHPDRLSCFEVEGERFGAPIFAALATGSREAVGALLKAQADTEPQTSQLHGLCEQYYQNEDKRVGIGRDFRFSRRRSLLSYLAEVGDDIILAFVLSSGKHNADIESKDKHGRSPLWYAAEGGHEAAVRLLLDKDPDIEAADKHGQTPLSRAAGGGHEAIVRLLLNRGANIEATDKNGLMLLPKAAGRGYEGVVRLLLDWGTDIEGADKYGQTPLSRASGRGHEAVVRLLLNWGANIESADKNGQTPLWYAAKEGHEAVVRILVNRGANVKVTDKEGRMLLSRVAKGGHEAVMRVLLDWNTDIEATDKDGRTPLWYASREGHKAVVQLLLDKDPNIEATDEDGRTPLWYAAKGGHEAVVKLLLDRGANVEAADKDGQTPLSLAVRKGQEAVVKLLRATEGVNDAPPEIQPETPPETPPALALPPTDLRYASTSAMEMALDGPRKHGDQATAESAHELAERDVDDTATEYSNMWSMMSSRKQQCIEELAGDLFSKISCLKAGEKTRADMLAILSELLQAFALKLGHNAPTQMHRDVMAFVHRYRRDIAEAFVDISFERDKEDLKRIMADPDGMSSEEGMSVQDRMALWEEKENYEEVSVEEGIRLGLDDIDSDGSGGRSNGPDPEVEVEEMEDEEVSDGWLLAYRESIPSTEAYKWLLTRLRRECLLVSAEPNTIQAIRATIISSLPTAHTVSSRASPRSFSARFELDWDILDFFQSQGYSSPPDQVLEGVITLTGSCHDAQAATCAQYIRQTWPLTGEAMLQLVKEVLRGGEGHTHSCKISDGTTLTAWTSRSKFVVEYDGVAISIAETAEQLAWLGAALRTSPRQSGLVYCTPIITNILQNSAKSQTSLTDITCEIGFTVEEVPKPPSNANGQCWHDIFRNPVVVKGYPIPKRIESETGLEISLNIMAGLARTERVDRFKEKVYIKGFSTMLVPTKRSEDILCWHLIYKKDGSRISYLDEPVKQEKHFGSLDLENLRHVLGWCSEARFYAGSAQAEHPNTYSRLPKPHEGCALANMRVSAGRMIMGGPAFSVGDKDTPAHVSRSGYIPRLEWISTKFVLLWDEDDKRGWLINGTSALLHVLRASLEYGSKGKFRSALLCKSEDLEESPTPFTADSAIDVLINRNNLNLKLHHEGDQYLLLESLIERFYNVLEKLIDHQIDIAGDCGRNLSDKPRRHLEGWDFEDLAKKQDPLYPCVATLKAAGKGWIDFMRAIHAVTLIGRGFGEIIRPAGANICEYWSELPKGQYYMASCLSDLAGVMREHDGRRDNHVRLSDKLIWHTPTTVFASCRCRGALGGDHCEPVQTLYPLELSARLLPRKHAIQHEGNGAVIFGHSSYFSWVWGDTGHPQEGKLNEVEMDTDSPKDSGIGPSLASSGSEGQLSSQPRSNTRRLTWTPSESHNDAMTTDSPAFVNQKRYGRGQYKVGIICALPKELMAVRALFDDGHDTPGALPFDTNQYSLGVMEQHWIVAACLPNGEYGTNSAAAVASNMIRSFTSIRFCLLVGIAGGAPSEKNDIRLGDVVVSKPTGNCSGVIQYDLGKEKEGKAFERTGSLRPPPRVLNTAVSSLCSDPALPADPLAPHLRAIAARLTEFPKYRRPEKPDVLSQTACAACRARDISREECSHLRQRVPRPTLAPVIHYGLIASGNRVVKDVAMRDQLANDGVLCIEMEAAGVLNTVDCLVIRGICDYCDAQKNDDWQEYAAAAAAAYAKLLLRFVANEEDTRPPRKRRRAK